MQITELPHWWGGGLYWLTHRQYWRLPVIGCCVFALDLFCLLPDIKTFSPAIVFLFLWFPVKPFNIITDRNINFIISLTLLLLTLLFQEFLIGYFNSLLFVTSFFSWRPFWWGWFRLAHSPFSSLRLIIISFFEAVRTF